MHGRVLFRMSRRAYNVIVLAVDRLRGIDRALGDLAEDKRPAVPMVEPDEVAAWYRTIDEQWAGLPVEDKRLLLLRIGAHIVVNTGARPNWIEFASELPIDPITVRMTSGRK